MERSACLLLLSLLVGFAQGNDNGRYSVEGKSSDQEAYESFGAPLYGGAVKPGSYPPKSGYPLPPTVPAGYSGYLTGYGPYSRYGVLPYSSSPYYGGQYNALPYGYGVNPVLGSAYGNPGFGNSVYGFPGYAGRIGFGGLGYNSAYFRAPGVPAPLPYGVPPLPAGYAPLAYPAGSAPSVAGRPPVLAPQGKDGRYPQRLQGY